MRYFANPSTQIVRDAMRADLIGCILTPAQGNLLPAGVVFCADNGCFGDGYPGDVEWFAWLSRLPADRCAFAVAPDVVADAAATLERSAPFLPAIRSLGMPAAFVAQDGLEDLTVPWDAFDALFIGGSTGWKLGAAARGIAAEAVARGKHVHMGRVNSHKRLRYAQAIGCHSVDGTCIAFGPTKNLKRMSGWLHEVNHQAGLFDAI